MENNIQVDDAPRPWGIYVHIPFCRQKCYYCDFASWAGREHYMADYTAALLQELYRRGARYAARWGRPATMYIGGGTPTALPREQLLAIVTALQGVGAAGKTAALTPCRAGAADGHASGPQGLSSDLPLEFTVEANPGTVDEAYLAALRCAGVNRLSFGVQSFDDRLLRRIGRIHTAAQARASFAAARAAGFDNISLDLMYGLPGQTLSDLQSSVEQALALGPEHISIYGLQLEPGTVFARQQEQGRLELPDDDTAEAMYDYMTTALPQAGYERYEISNFARPGRESRHNMSYWQDVPYLGIGAAAHSYLDGQRYENMADIAGYIKAVTEGESVTSEEEPATRQIAMEEYAFLALRMVRGISRDGFAARFGVTLESVYGEVIARLEAQGLLQTTPEAVALTPQGMKLGNQVFAEFLL